MAALPHYLLDAMESAGVNPAGVARSVGLCPEKLLLKLSAEEADRFFMASWRTVNNPGFGLTVGAALRPERFGAVGFCAMVSPTLDTAFRCIARYARLAWGGECELLRHADETTFRVELIGPARPYSRMKIDVELSAACALARKLTGLDIRPLRVRLRSSAPSYAAEYSRVFGCPILFDQEEDSMTLRNEDMARKLPAANAEIFDTFERLAEAALSEEGELSTDQRVRMALRRVLRGDAPTLADVASNMCMSTRTLQRKLSDEGLSFSQIVDETRKEIAQRYITQNQASLVEIAYMLGFSDPPSFYRAFKRWTGTTPRGYREPKPA